MSATRNFFWIEKILFLAKVIALSNLKNTYNYIAQANFNRDFPKIIFSSYNFLGNPLKLVNYVLGTKTKLLSEPMFDFGFNKMGGSLLRSE